MLHPHAQGCQTICQVTGRMAVFATRGVAQALPDALAEIVSTWLR